MSTVTEFFKAFQEGIANKDSSRLGASMTDDFELVTTVRTMNKQQCLDGVAGGGNPTIVSKQGHGN